MIDILTFVTNGRSRESHGAKRSRSIIPIPSYSDIIFDVYGEGKGVCCRLLSMPRGRNIPIVLDTAIGEIGYVFRKSVAKSISGLIFRPIFLGAFDACRKNNDKLACCVAQYVSSPIPRFSHVIVDTTTQINPQTGWI